MADRLNGKVAIVTGGTSGIGKSVAIAFLKEGAKVVVQGRRPERIKALEDEVAALGLSDNLRIVVGDVTSDEDCEAAIQCAVDAFGTLNVLSHNAGITDDMSLVDEITNELWDRLIEVNLTGSMKIARACLRYFMANEIKANMVMTTSNCAFESVTSGPSYCASKAGANALMKAIAFEYMRYGIRCNSICPGPVYTNIAKSAGGKFSERGYAIHGATGYNAHHKEWTGMMCGMPDEIAPLAVYLASDESSFMNGNSCVIDKGVCLSH